MTDQTTESANLPSDSTDPTDVIADLLIGDDKDSKTDDLEESTEAEKLAEDSTDEDDVEESNESEESDEEDDSDDQTWGAALGIEEDKLSFDEDGNINGVNVKVNGKQSTVDMKELVTGYQSNKSYTEKSMALADERKTFEADRQQVQQDYNSKLENVESITNYLSNKLVSEFEGINWDQLRVENPAEYAAARQDYASRAQELKQAQEAVGQERQQQQAQNQQANQARQSTYLKSQFDELVTKNPEWIDDTARSEAMTEIKQFAVNQYGFTMSAFDTISDAKVVEVLKDAMAYRNGVKTAATKKKKPVPKFRKSTRKSTKRTSKLDKLTKIAKTSSGATKREAQGDAVAELLMGG